MRPLFLMIAAFAMLGAVSRAEERHAAALSPIKAFAPFAQKHCVECHDADDQKGGFNMEALLAEPTVDKSPAAWHSVLERIVSRDMPPVKRKERPTETDYRSGESWVRGQLELNEAFAAMQRPRPMRRLNSDEYNRSIQQVFGIDFKAADGFPADDAVDGFTNIGEGLNLSTVLIEKYLAAGRAVADRAIVEGAQTPSKKWLFTHGKDATRKTDGEFRGFDPGGAALQLPNLPVRWVGDHFFVEVNAPARGRYAVRLRGTTRNLGVRPGYKPHFQYRLHNEFIYQGDVAIQNDAEFTQEFFVTLEKGRANLDLRWTNGFPDNNSLRGQGLLIKLPPTEEDNKKKKDRFAARGVWDLLQRDGWREKFAKDPTIQYPFPYFEASTLEIEGPLYPDGWPVSRFQRENAAAIAARDARKVSEWLLPRLFRRPASADEVGAFAAYVAEAEKALEIKAEPARFAEALRMGVQRALVSPKFLFMVEPGPTGRALSDPELATRLAYFLWSAPPDDALAALAAEGKLRPVLAAQTERMLADPRSAAFVERFTMEWLGLARLSSAMPEPKLFKRFDEQLRGFMIEEPIAVVGHLLRENLPLDELLDAPYTFMNDRLADHYQLPSLWSMTPLKLDGFEPVSGGEMRKVTLPDRRRGGLVAQGAYLALSSENTRTSPVKRGVWILEKLFNRPPPPPPPNVSGIIPDVTKATTGVEQLRLHRDLPNCAGCHAKIDPLGLALENFDATGEWRDREFAWEDPASPDSLRKKLGLSQWADLPSFPIDASFAMGDVEGQGVEALKKYLVANREKFARGFTEKLAMYALGRKLLLSDDAPLAAVRTSAQRDGFRFRALILALVQSKLFETR